MSSLLPPDCDGLLDAPYPLADAISMGLRFLRFEELPPEETPPKRIWLDPPAMNAHWTRVDQDRKAKYGGTTSGGPMDDNDAARDLVL